MRTLTRELSTHEKKGGAVSSTLLENSKRERIGGQPKAQTAPPKKGIKIKGHAGRASERETSLRGEPEQCNSGRSVPSRSPRCR